MDRSLTYQRGLTLVELLVVLAVLAFAVGVAVVNAPPPRSGAKHEAERFAALLVAAAQNAASSGAPARARLETTGYSFERYDGDGWRADRAERALPAHMSLDARPRASAAANAALKDRRAPQWLTLDPIGMTDAYDVVFADGGERWLVSVDAAGRVEVKRDDGR